MERRLGGVLLGFVAILGAGCGKSDGPPADVAAHSPAGDQSSQSAGPKCDTPDAAVRSFLDAAKAGDQHRLTDLLSEPARVETVKKNINFELDSYQEAKFDVGKVELAPDEKGNADCAARVDCAWSDSGMSRTVVWVLRKEQPGWRIVGMMTKPFPDLDWFVFNYEDASSLTKARDAIEAEVNKREEKRIQEEQAAAKKPPLEAKADKPVATLKK